MSLTTTMQPEAATAPQAARRRSMDGVIEQSRLAQFVLLLGFALLVRGAAIGEWNYDVDEQFYALVGRRMLAGATLYVDIWDRKPPALYLTYAAIALLSPSVIAFQLAATFSVTAGAFGIARIAQRIAGVRGGLMAGIAYLALLNRFGGTVGQAPVWYNTLMIFAAWTLVKRMDLLRRGRIDITVAVGMAAAGLAVAFKQSAAIECMFMGLYAVICLWRSRMSRPRVLAQAAILAAVAMLPLAGTFGWYWHIGHLPELWQALVQSNIAREYTGSWNRLFRLAVLAAMISMPGVFAVLGWRTLSRDARRAEPVLFVTAWALVAIVAVVSFPNIFLHYALPILPPLCILAAAFFGRSRSGLLALAAVLAVTLPFGGSLDLVARAQARRAAPVLVDYVRQQTPNKRLFVWGAPSFLYVLTGATPPSRLAFAPHLFDGAEIGTSGMDEVAEVRRIIAGAPETVVVQDPLVASPTNDRTIALVQAYVRTCRKARRFALYDHDGKTIQIVYSRCPAPASAPGSPRG